MALSQYTDGAAGFSIHFPDGWQVTSHPDPGSGVAVLFSGPGYPEGPAVHVYVTDIEPGTTLEDYVRARIAEITATVPGQEFLDEGEARLGRLSAYFLSYATTLQPANLDILFGEAIAVAGERAFITTYIAPLDSWQQHAPLFQVMASTFEIAQESP